MIQAEMFGVFLSDEQVAKALSCVTEPSSFLQAIRVFKQVGWMHADAAMLGLIDRLPRHGRERLSCLMEIVEDAGGRPPEFVARALFDTALELGEVGFLSNELGLSLDELSLPWERYKPLLDEVVRLAGLDVQPEFGIGFPHLKAWLEYVAPLIYPKVEMRMCWFLGFVCEHIESVSQESRYVLTEPVLEWLRGAREHAGELDLMLIDSMDRWLGVLDWDDMEEEVLDARLRLGLPDPCDEEEDE